MVWQAYLSSEAIISLIPVFTLAVHSVAKTDEYRCKKDEMEVVMATVAHDIETRDFEELDETLYEKTLQLNASVADFLKKEAREEFSYDADSATQVMQRFHIA